MKQIYLILRKVVIATSLITAGALSSFTATATADQISPAHTVIELFSGSVMGGSQNRKWISGDQAASKAKGGDTYQVFGSNYLIGKFTGKAPKYDDGGPAVRFSRYYVPIPVGRSDAQIAISANWNVMPRRVKSEGTNQAIYRNEVAKILRAHKIKNPVVKIKKIWRVDLDGNGTDEVLIEATYFKSGSLPTRYVANDYSFILLRQIVNGKVKTAIVDGGFYSHTSDNEVPNEYSLLGVYDLNGDGKMEIVHKLRYYEGEFLFASEVKNVLVGGAGA